MLGHSCRNGVISVNNCGWYLWLNGRMIYNIRQLRENFDTALLTGYFLGGSLMKWLSDLGEYSIIKRLSVIDTAKDIGEQLEFAFGVVPDKRHEPPAPAPVITVTAVPEANDEKIELSVYTGSYYGLSESSFAAYESSFLAFESSFRAFESSFASIVGNAVAAMFRSSFTGFETSSYSAFVTGQVLNLTSSWTFGSGSSFAAAFAQNLLKFSIAGSFTGSSFTFGSFGYLFGKYAQFVSGSYGFGSYGSWVWQLFRNLGIAGSLGSFGSFGNLDMFFGEGSFRYSPAGATITAEEYHRTLINLSSCPLNAYGYGINLI